MKDRYRDIINLPHYTSPTRPRMPLIDRAAQFASFAALVGYDAAIKETGRLTNEKIELCEDELFALNEKFKLLQQDIKSCPEITITYFKPDERKQGGEYVTISGRVKRIDEYEKLIVMSDGIEIIVADIVSFN